MARESGNLVLTTTGTLFSLVTTEKFCQQQGRLLQHGHRRKERVAERRLSA